MSRSKRRPRWPSDSSTGGQTSANCEFLFLTKGRRQPLFDIKQHLTQYSHHRREQSCGEKWMEGKAARGEGRKTDQRCCCCCCGGDGALTHTTNKYQNLCSHSSGSKPSVLLIKHLILHIQPQQDTSVLKRSVLTPRRYNGTVYPPQARVNE